MKLSDSARRKLYRALVPGELFEGGHEGDLHASYHESSGILNIYPSVLSVTEKSDLLTGCLCPSEEIDHMRDRYDFLVVIDADKGNHVEFRNDSYEIETYDLVQNVFSRNGGLIESEQMASKHVVIFGCGSVGSLVALELARVGVGHFLLIDNDVLEYHNICRHQCGIHEVGDYKVDAVRARILDINPTAQVDVSATLAEYLPKEQWDTWVGENHALCIGCADNREADAYISSRCVIYGAPFLSIGFWERAFAGEIFYWLPDADMACYRCALGDGALGSRNSSSRRLYTTQDKLEDVHFEPGIAVDIDFVTNIGAKVALDIMNISNSAFTQRLLPTLRQYTLVCNTNDPAVGGEMAELFSYPLQVTTSLQVEAKPGCECTMEGRSHE